MKSTLETELRFDWKGLVSYWNCLAPPSNVLNSGKYLKIVILIKSQLCPFMRDQITTKAWSGRFWMGQFNSASPKPHIIYSNDEAIIQQILDRAGYMSRQDQQRCPSRTSRTYYDKLGVKRAVGLKKEMRESQYLALVGVFFSSELVSDPLLWDKWWEYFHRRIPVESSSTLSIYLKIWQISYSNPALRHYPAEFGKFMAEVFLSREGVSWLKLLEWESVWHSCTMKKIFPWHQKFTGSKQYV